MQFLGDYHTVKKEGVLPYQIARKFRGVKSSRKLIRLSFRDFIFTDSDPIAIINDANIVSRIKIFTDQNFHGREQIRENRENCTPQNFLAIRYSFLPLNKPCMCAVAWAKGN